LNDGGVEMSTIVIDQHLFGIPRPFGEQSVNMDDLVVQKRLKIRRRLLKFGIGLLVVVLLLTVVWVEPTISNLSA
jgi:hypothetical protein